MSREFSGWGVSLTGALLALVGVYWLYAGWEHIQIERGWSQFIAGATALSGGVVTLAIGRLIRVLLRQTHGVATARGIAGETINPPTARTAARVSDPPKRIRSSGQATSASMLSSSEALNIDASPRPETEASARAETSERSSGSIAPASGVDDRRPDTEYAGSQEPAEVDRYTAGDSTYVMYSDGSVEVRTPSGTRLYESLDDLRANSGER